MIFKKYIFRLYKTDLISLQWLSGFVANMIGARAVKCLVSPDWLLLALVAASVPACVPVSRASEAQPDMVSVPVDPATNSVPITQLSVDPNTGKELAKNNTYAFEYSKGFRMPGKY